MSMLSRGILWWLNPKYPLSADWNPSLGPISPTKNKLWAKLQSCTTYCGIFCTAYWGIIVICCHLECLEGARECSRPLVAPWRGADLWRSRLASPIGTWPPRSLQFFLIRQATTWMHCIKKVQQSSCTILCSCVHSVFFISKWLLNSKKKYWV